MTLEQSKILVKGDGLIVEQLFDGGLWLDEAAGDYQKFRRPAGTKVKFVQHHHHLPEFLFCEEGGETAIYHHDELKSDIIINRWLESEE